MLPVSENKPRAHSQKAPVQIVAKYSCSINNGGCDQLCRHNATTNRDYCDCNPGHTRYFNGSVESCIGEWIRLFHILIVCCYQAISISFVQQLKMNWHNFDSELRHCFSSPTTYTVPDIDLFIHVDGKGPTIEYIMMDLFDYRRYSPSFDDNY